MSAAGMVGAGDGSTVGRVAGGDAVAATDDGAMEAGPLGDPTGLDDAAHAPRARANAPTTPHLAPGDRFCRMSSTSLLEDQDLGRGLRVDRAEDVPRGKDGPPVREDIHRT